MTRILFRFIALPLAVLACFCGNAGAGVHSASMPFGGSIEPGHAAVIAVAGARVSAVEEAAAEIAAEPLAAFAARTPERRLGLATALAHVWECNRQGTLAPPLVTMTLCSRLVPYEAGEAAPYLLERIKEQGDRPDRLAAYELLASRRKTLTAEAMALGDDARAALAVAAERGDAPQTPRILYLARALEALDLYESCLPYFMESTAGGALPVWDEPDLVIGRLERALVLDRSASFLWLALGEVLFQTGRLRPALDALDQAVALEPESGRARHERGVLHFSQGALSQAEQDMNAALRLAPERAELWQSRGALYFSQGRYAEMCEDFLGACRLGRCVDYENARRHGYCGAASQ